MSFTRKAVQLSSGRYHGARSASTGNLPHLSPASATREQPEGPPPKDTVRHDLVSGPAAPPAASDLVDLRAVVDKWLSIPAEDTDLLDFILAVFKSHEIPGDPLWGIVIDASGGGKTELLRPLQNLPNAHFLSNLTPKSLVSGYRDPKNPRRDPSLLPQLNGKVLIIKDLSPILSMRNDDRKQILGQLRDAYDGFTSEARGNIGCRTYHSRFSFLAGSTLAVDRHASVEQELGERFVRFRARGADTRGKISKALSHAGNEDQMRTELEQAVSVFLDSLPPIASFDVPPDLEARLIRLADFTARARSHVARNRKGELQYNPRPEVGTRLAKELGKLLVSLAAVRSKNAPDANDFETVRRVAEDCLPLNRLAVINALRSGPLTTKAVADRTQLAYSTARLALEDLALLDVVSKSETDQDEDLEKASWRLRMQP